MVFFAYMSKALVFLIIQADLLRSIDPIDCYWSISVVVSHCVYQLKADVMVRHWFDSRHQKCGNLPWKGIGIFSCQGIDLLIYWLLLDFEWFKGSRFSKRTIFSEISSLLEIRRDIKLCVNWKLRPHPVYKKGRSILREAYGERKFLRKIRHFYEENSFYQGCACVRPPSHLVSVQNSSGRTA